MVALIKPCSPRYVFPPFYHECLDPCHPVKFHFQPLRQPDVARWLNSPKGRVTPEVCSFSGAGPEDMGMAPPASFPSPSLDIEVLITLLWPCRWTLWCGGGWSHKEEGTWVLRTICQRALILPFFASLDALSKAVSSLIPCILGSLCLTVWSLVYSTAT